MTPLNDYVVIERTTEDKTKSGIVLAESPEQDRGEVLAIGPNVKKVEVGQTVVFRKYSPEVIVLDGKDMLLVQETNLLAIL
jgi:chaperonin GroES